MRGLEARFFFQPVHLGGELANLGIQIPRLAFMGFLLLTQGRFPAGEDLTPLSQEGVPPLAQHVGVHAAFARDLRQAAFAADDLEGPAGLLFRRVGVSFPCSWHVPNLLYFGSPECLKILGHYTRPAFISEADIISPCSNGEISPGRINLFNKDDAADQTQESIWRFIQQANWSGQGSDYVAVWALSISYRDPETTGVNCADWVEEGNENMELAWHEAYRDQPVNGSYEREWFRLWWLRRESLAP